MISIMKIYSNYRLTDITSSFFLLHASITIIAYIVLGESEFLSWSAIGLIVVLDLSVFLSLRLADRGSAPILITAAWFILMFFLPRLTAFQLFPTPNVSFPALEPFTQSEIEMGMAYIVAGYIVLWTAVWAVSRFAAQPEAGHDAPNIPLAAIALYSAIAFASTYYIYFIVGVSVYDEDPTKWGSRIGWVSILFNIDVALLAAIVWMVRQPSAGWRRRVVLLAIVAIWLGFALALGSRGGPLRVLILLGLAAIAIFGNPVVSWARVAVIVTIAVAASSVMYPLGTFIRLVPTSGEAAAENLAADWFRTGPVQEISSEWARKAWANSAVVQHFALYTGPVVARLGLIDYPIAIIAREPDREVVDHYLAIQYGLKNFANNLVPGEIYPEYDVMTSRVFTMAYRGFSEQHVRTTFLSEPWTLWGFSWLKGGVFGGLFIIAGFGMLAQIGYAFIPKVLGPMLTPYANASYLFVPVTAGVLQLFGLDHALTTMVHFGAALLLMFTMALLIRWCTAFLGP